MLVKLTKKSFHNFTKNIQKSAPLGSMMLPWDFVKLLHCFHLSIQVSITHNMYAEVVTPVTACSEAEGLPNTKYLYYEKEVCLG
jgi:hypothetical protein